MPVPDPTVWAFDPRNDSLFALDNQIDPVGPAVTAEEWVRRGPVEIQHELEKALELERVKSRKSRKSFKSAVHEEQGHAHEPMGHSSAGQAGAAGAAGGAAGDVGGD